ncbi:MAG: N-acetylornithine carbamoyltransferase [Rhodothermales bacterium]
MPGSPMLDNLIDWHLHTDQTWNSLIERALWHRNAKEKWSKRAAGKSIGLLFFNSSLRTRTSMELAAAQLGAHSTTLNIGQGTWGFSWDDGAVMDGNEAEHIREAVGVLSNYYDALGVRMFASLTDYNADRDEVLFNKFVDAATVPVVNLESAFYHPCQALSDAAALSTHFNGDVKGKKFVLAWCHHPRALPMAVPNSALLMAARSGMDVTLACPEAYKLDQGVLDLATQYTNEQGTSFTHTDDLNAAAQDAEVIYAKAWSGPAVYQGKDAEEALRMSNKQWRITSELMKQTNKGVFMHCLPVRRNVVVDDAVIDSKQAIHLLQAEYRLHAQKAILEHVWGLVP